MKNVEKMEFSAGAAFRIFGSGLDFDGVTRELGLNPDHQHRQGEFDPGKRPYAHDMWSLKSPLRSDDEIEVHLGWLMERLLSRKNFIVALEEKFEVDIYCWKTCYREQSSIVISSNTLQLFTELNLKLEISLLCLPPGSEEEQPKVASSTQTF